MPIKQQKMKLETTIMDVPGGCPQPGVVLCRTGRVLQSSRSVHRLRMYLQAHVKKAPVLTSQLTNASLKSLHIKLE